MAAVRFTKVSARSISPMVLIWATIIPLACGSEEPLAPDEIPFVDGVWSFNETINSGFGSASSCTSFGSLSIAQDGEVFGGNFQRSQTCSGAQSLTSASPASQTQSGEIKRGRVERTALSFELDDCRYEGSLEGNPPKRISGSVLCTSISDDLTPVTRNGTWQAERVTETRM